MLEGPVEEAEVQKVSEEKPEVHRLGTSPPRRQKEPPVDPRVPDPESADPGYTPEPESWDGAHVCLRAHLDESTRVAELDQKEVGHPVPSTEPPRTVRDRREEETDREAHVLELPVVEVAPQQQVVGELRPSTCQTTLAFRTRSVSGTNCTGDGRGDLPLD